MDTAGHPLLIEWKGLAGDWRAVWSGPPICLWYCSPEVTGGEEAWDVDVGDHPRFRVNSEREGRRRALEIAHAMLEQWQRELHALDWSKQKVCIGYQYIPESTQAVQCSQTGVFIPQGDEAYLQIWRGHDPQFVSADWYHRYGRAMIGKALA